VRAYNYGNGVAHSVSQNLRGLPQVMTDAGKVSDQYAYDANANVTAITDLPICRKASARVR
jgi:YD repeat-containing protein